MEDDHSLNADLITYNHYMNEAVRASSEKNFSLVIHNYEQALETDEAQQSLEKQALILQNIGVIYFHNCEYKKSLELLEKALPLVESSRGSFGPLLQLKLLANISIVQLINNNYEEAKRANIQALQLINKTPDIPGEVSEKRMLFEEMMSIYFRFKTFEDMGEGQIDNLHLRYDGATLGCVYSAMGINRELCDDFETAFRYHKKALDVWKQQKQNGFIVITLRRLILLGTKKQINLTAIENRNLLAELDRYIQSDELKGLSAENLFSDCERKLQCAREITQNMQEFESQLTSSPRRNFTTKDSEIERSELWRRAVRYRLHRALNYSKYQMESSTQNKQLLQQAVLQLQRTLDSLNQPQSHLIEAQIINQQFTKESINHLKAQVNKFRKNILKMIQHQYFKQLKENYLITKEMNQTQDMQRQQLQSQVNSSQQQSKQTVQTQISRPPDQRLNPSNSQHLAPGLQFVQSQYGSQIHGSQSHLGPMQHQYPNPMNQMNQTVPIVMQSENSGQVPTLLGSHRSNGKLVIPSRKGKVIPPKKFYTPYYYSTTTGDYLVKCNKNTNGRIQRYFKMGEDNTFRWAAKEKHINDPSKIQYYQISDIKGLVFGKCTDVLTKSYNKELEPYLCFSLIMRSRSMDFVATAEQIDSWVISLSEEIRRRNPISYTLTPGQYYWRKLKMRLFWVFIINNPAAKKDKKFRKTVSNAIKLFALRGYSLPVKL